MKNVIFTLGALLVFANQTTAQTELPNIIIIFCDDLGYGDLGVYGSAVHRTPHLDQMATDGALFTDFYVTSGVCTPSRASLLTGCYPRRVDMHVNARHPDSIGTQVLFPMAKKGLNPNEITIAELLKEQGYATACIGKWHLGDQLEFLPTRQGFDTYFGIPYSNDMNRDFVPLPLMRDEEVIEAPVDQNTITQRYTQEAINFIQAHSEKPFFIYLPHAMTHNPLHASDNFRDKSANGIYGDAVEELDWSTGQILTTLKEQGLEENTLIIFTSDNGAASRWGGSNGDLRGWKGSTWEGGMRVPGIMQWKGTIPAGRVITEMASTLDILPTIAQWTQSSLPNDRVIDGFSLAPLLLNDNVSSPYVSFFYYQKAQLQAVRSGKWKLHLALDSTYQSNHYPGFKEGRAAELYNLEEDRQEQHNIAAKQPEVVQQLEHLADYARQHLGDLRSDGDQIRPAATVENPTVRLLEK
ncbi:sulfatase family protein [Tunicatimonas pelagia]|uniref:sulfatase family protein n=1 Tax=Tunicatimonas pelagia TaxID=931531 RepID=UPI0026651299|nr:sulfatase [Tunicatimonas pelagia]WKN43774.1 sulfatase [Tunicatimonas pelagia]